MGLRVGPAPQTHEERAAEARELKESTEELRILRNEVIHALRAPDDVLHLTSPPIEVATTCLAEHRVTDCRTGDVVCEGIVEGLSRETAHGAHYRDPSTHKFVETNLTFPCETLSYQTWRVRLRASFAIMFLELSIWYGLWLGQPKHRGLIGMTAVCVIASQISVLAKTIASYPDLRTELLPFTVMKERPGCLHFVPPYAKQYELSPLVRWPLGLLVLTYLIPLRLLGPHPLPPLATIATDSALVSFALAAWVKRDMLNFYGNKDNRQPLPKPYPGLQLALRDPLLRQLGPHPLPRLSRLLTFLGS